MYKFQSLKKNINRVIAGLSATSLMSLAIAYDTAEFGNFVPAHKTALMQRINNFDSRTTKTFRSVEDCIKQGFNQKSCETAQYGAKEINRQRGTSLEYESEGACLTNHAQCDRVTYQYRTGHPRIPHHNVDIVYKPAMVGWQSAASEITAVVPLYSAKGDNKGVRFDGKILKLDS